MHFVYIRSYTNYALFHRYFLLVVVVHFHTKHDDETVLPYCIHLFVNHFYTNIYYYHCHHLEIPTARFRNISHNVFFCSRLRSQFRLFSVRYHIRI